jgi:glycine/D-amino acid oxidase-like deaminating enzyme
MKVAVIGGGIAGSGVAIYLQNLGVDITLFEKKDSLVSGPPMCHLHAGGNLYPEISDEQCLQLLEESIELLRFFPEAIDFRPTIVAVQKDVNVSLDKIFNRLEKLKARYKELIKQDKNNKVLDEVENYYKIYTKEDILKLKDKEYKKPESLDDWMIPFAKNVDIDTIKWPVILVQEYGLNVFRIAASATILLDKNLKLNTEVINIEKNNKFIITYKENNDIKTEEFDYLINAAGFETGKFDDMLGEKRERFTEFKAAYVVKWRDDIIWPEVVFLGERGTPKGMGQFTPYAGGYYQLHAMTKEITLFENGLVKTENSSYPNLDNEFIEKIEKGWDKEYTRSNKAIKHLQKFIPSFDAKAGYKPLYGAQQIPGDDADLRAAEVSFSTDYARCEIVKASSIFAMARDIVNKLNIKDIQNHNKSLSNKEVDDLAMKIAESRGYPKEMGRVINPFKG